MEEPEYIYQWSGQPSAAQNVIVSPIIPTDYFISVTDVCGQVISDVVFVDFQLYEELILSSDTVYTCYNQLEEVCIEVNRNYSKQYELIYDVMSQSGFKSNEGGNLEILNKNSNINEQNEIKNIFFTRI